jgi:hypothetical protein
MPEEGQIRTNRRCQKRLTITVVTMNWKARRKELPKSSKEVILDTEKDSRRYITLSRVKRRMNKDLIQIGGIFVSRGSLKRRTGRQKQIPSVHVKFRMNNKNLWLARMNH